MARGFGLDTTYNTDVSNNPIGVNVTDAVIPTPFVFSNLQCTIEAEIMYRGGSGSLIDLRNSAGTSILFIWFTTIGSPPNLIDRTYIIANWTNTAGAQEEWYGAFDLTRGWSGPTSGPSPRGSSSPQFIHFMCNFSMDSRAYPRIWINGEQYFPTTVIATPSGGTVLANRTVDVTKSFVGNGNITSSKPWNGMVNWIRVYNDGLTSVDAVAHARGRNLNNWQHMLLFDCDMSGDRPTLIDAVTNTQLTVVGTRQWNIQGRPVQHRKRRLTMPTPQSTRYTSARRVFQVTS